jgi:hypothetical protein
VDNFQERVSDCRRYRGVCAAEYVQHTPDLW